MLAGMPRRLYPCTPTRLASWLDCPRRYRMTYLDRPAPHQGKFPDFPGQLTAIGERLLGLPRQTRVLAGHGEESTIADATKRFDGWVAASPSEDVD